MSKEIWIKYLRWEIPYTIWNLRYLNSQLTKTVHCGLETITSKGPQIWQVLPKKKVPL